jgi:hypothetical protein
LEGIHYAVGWLEADHEEENNIHPPLPTSNLQLRKIILKVRHAVVGESLPERRLLAGDSPLTVIPKPLEGRR